MKLRKYAYFVPVILSVYLLVSGYKIISPLPLTYDPALHAEIATYLIPANLIPRTWEPLADVAYTYPPLFHWVAFLLSASGFETYKIVIFMGLFLYALFPVSFYIYGRAFGEKEAVLFSFFGAIQASLIEVFAAGEYPQLLSMNLLVIVLYFLAKRSYINAGIFSGLTALSHTFTAVYTAALIVIYYFMDRKKIKSEHATAFVLAAFLISVVWLPRYMEIADNAINNRWENTIWYYKSGFVGAEKISDMFFSVMPGSRMGAILLLLSTAGMFYLYTKKIYFPIAAFLFTFIFTIFHVPGTQYKFPDMLAVVAPPLAAVGVFNLSKKTSLGKFAALGALMFLVALNPYTNAINLHNCCVSKDIPNQAQTNLAEWARNNDTSKSLVLVDGDYEVWFALIAHKYPMNPRISELEVFTEKYRRLLDDRKNAINEIRKNYDPAKTLITRGVEYVVTEKSLNSSYFRVIREENGTKLYKYYP
ncbi:MAG: hypothetical protein HY515_04180 [Candidatus Aenigmarchaeota archaeon]|nr:hypothetical protein [Candidatus Aenigmarchaeota archaeon]